MVGLQDHSRRSIQCIRKIWEVPLTKGFEEPGVQREVTCPVAWGGGRRPRTRMQALRTGPWLLWGHDVKGLNSAVFRIPLSPCRLPTTHFRTRGLRKEAIPPRGSCHFFLAHLHVPLSVLRPPSLEVTVGVTLGGAARGWLCLLLKGRPRKPQQECVCVCVCVCARAHTHQGITWLPLWPAASGAWERGKKGSRKSLCPLQAPLTPQLQSRLRGREDPSPSFAPHLPESWQVPPHCLPWTKFGLDFWIFGNLPLPFDPLGHVCSSILLPHSLMLTTSHCSRMQFQSLPPLPCAQHFQDSFMPRRSSLYTPHPGGGCFQW